jgi:hypothetical protein
VSDLPDDPGTPARARALLLKCWSDGEASVIRQLLTSYGIPCQIVSDITHTVLPITIDGLGEIRILVPASRLQEARTLIADHRRSGLRVIRGGRADRGEDDTDPARGPKRK